MRGQIIFLFFWILFSAAAVHSIECGDKLCLCNKANGIATCNKNKEKFTYVPKLPPYIKKVRFTTVTLKNLTKHLFHNISTLKLEGLSFKNTKTVSISSDTFSIFPYLKRLEITENSGLQPDILGKSLFGVSRSIEKLFLENNIWTNLPPDVFDGLYYSNISQIKLTKNRLQSFNGSTYLSKIPYIKYLDLSKNNINHDLLVLKNMKYVSKLFLGNNQIRKNLEFCEFGNTSLLPRLRTLRLNDNLLKHFSVFRCLPDLWKLDLSSNVVKKLASNTFSELPFITDLTLSNLGSLKYVDTSAFNTSSLQKLTFENNKFHFDKNGKYQPYYLFQYCPNLTFLNLGSNYLPSNSQLMTILYPLKNLRTLILSSTHLNALYRGVFDRMSSLQKLVLSSNSLGGWQTGVFDGLMSLRSLYLEGNDITFFNKTSIPLKILNNLEILNLGNNPFTCSCDQLWFRDWLKETNISLCVYPQRYTCKSPPEWKGKQIAKLNLTTEDCEEKNPWILVGIIVSSSSFMCIIIVVVTCFHMPTIKNFIYMMKLKQKGYIRLINEQHYTFDAFTIYSPSDEAWVFHTLLKRLEEEGDLKLCIPHRDFGAGNFHADDIEQGMTDSRKLLIVLSNEFAKNEWCQWQLQLVQERIRQKGRDSIVLVLLRNINSKSMTLSLRSLLNSASYASWSTGKLRQNLFWKVVIRALKKPIGNPPVAVL